MSTVRPDMKVRYRSDPATAGWVIAVAGETARVFIDGTAKLVPVEELEPVPGITEVSPESLRVVFDAAQARTSGHRPASVVQGIQDKVAISPVLACEEDAGIAGSAPPHR